MVAASSAGDPIWMGRIARLYPISIGKPTYRHCEFRTGLRPVPLDETGHPLFHTLRPPFAGRTAALLLLFPTPGLLRNFAPRNEDPARSEAAGGRSQRWRNKGTLQAFFQASPKLACFAPSLSKQIFRGFVGFQGVTRFPNAL